LVSASASAWKPEQTDAAVAVTAAIKGTTKPGIQLNLLAKKLSEPAILRDLSEPVGISSRGIALLKGQFNLVQGYSVQGGAVEPTIPHIRRDSARSRASQAAEAGASSDAAGGAPTSAPTVAAAAAYCPDCTVDSASLILACSARLTTRPSHTSPRSIRNTVNCTQYSHYSVQYF
jgi:hypothetical protein